MIKLKEARRKAKKVEPDVAAYATLRGWQSQGVISQPLEIVSEGKQGGRHGLYSNNIIAEIITAQRLKKDYKLSEIAAARQELSKEVDFKNISQEELDGASFKIWAENETDKKYKIMQEKMQSGADQEEVNEAITDYQRSVELQEVKFNYLSKFDEVKQELGEFKTIDERLEKAN